VVAVNHSLKIRLDNARTALRLAREACAHWDLEDEPAPGRECCNALLDAIHEKTLAMRQVKGQS
jgi:hypothetical protein